MTPGCSVCGYAVEVVRSCFRSKWRLFNNSDTLTPGRYIFGDDETPAYPGWHNLWSRDWVDPMFPDWTLGEDAATARQWVSGAPIGPVPGADLIGSADCVANGDRWPLPVVPTLLGGFDARCPELLPLPFSGIDTRSPANYCFWAQILERVYVDAADAMRQVATALGVADNGFALTAPVGTTPFLFGLVPARPDPIVLAIGGTSTAMQWIAQINYGAGPPVSFGSFSTNFAWYNISTDVLNRLFDFGTSPDQDIIITGHSLGAAVAAVVAARLRLARPGRRIQLLLFACPRPGDERLIEILRTCETTTIVNDGDIVASIPCNVQDIPVALQPFLVPLYVFGSSAWEYPPNRKRVTWSGQVLEGAANPGPAEAVVQILLFVFSAGNFPDFSDHLPGEYRRRLCSPTVQPVVWLNAWDFEQPDGAFLAGWPNRVDAPNSPAALLSSGNAPVFRAPFANFARAVLFRASLGMRFPVSVVPDSDWSMFAVVNILRQSGDSGSVIAAAPLGDSGPAAGAVWEATSPASGTYHFLALLTGVDLPFAGNSYAPVLLFASLCAGTVAASLEIGPATEEGVQTGGMPFVDGFDAAVRCFFSSISAPNPTLIVGEVLLYDRCLSAPDQASVLDYLRVKWLVHGTGITAEDGTLLTAENGTLLVTE